MTIELIILAFCALLIVAWAFWPKRKPIDAFNEELRRIRRDRG